LEKIRLDILLHRLGMTPSREKARAIIMAGEVTVDGRMIDKAGTSVSSDAEIIITSSSNLYVSRGGLKLEKAIKVFELDFSALTVLDVGASTGGYTDCALQHGAQKVYAIDVGYGQLDWKLRNDERVINIERTNIRYFSPEDLGELADVVTVDVSFISTALVFPVIKNMVKDDGLIISLIKPQFEAGKKQVGKKGVVRDPEIHKQVLEKCIRNAQNEGLICTGVTYSPITGPRGNIEYFIKLEKNTKKYIDLHAAVNEVVGEAHSQLGG